MTADKDARESGTLVLLFEECKRAGYWAMTQQTEVVNMLQLKHNSSRTMFVK